MLEDDREEVAALGREVRAARAQFRRHLPKSLKEALGRMASRAMSKGTPMSTLAEELGVTAGSLRKYVQKARDQETSPVDFVPVSLSTPSVESPVSLVSPSGWRIEVADVATAVELLRALS